jgi:hypothetical protein
VRALGLLRFGAQQTWDAGEDREREILANTSDGAVESDSSLDMVVRERQLF